MTTRNNREGIISRLFNGAYGDFKGEKACECPQEALAAKKIQLAEFKLQIFKSQVVIVILAILFVGLTAGAITYAVFYPTLAVLLAITPVAVISGLIGLWFIGMWIAGSRIYHRYVCFELVCKDCNHTSRQTFDCLMVQKRSRCGQYTSKTCRDAKSPRGIDISYEFIEEKYGEMRDGLDVNPLSYNCIHWANEFYAKFD